MSAAVFGQFRAHQSGLDALVSVGLSEMETLTRTLLHAVAERDLVFDPKAPTRQDVEHIQQANVLLRHIIEDIAG
jgi:hypothetical protein